MSRILSPGHVVAMAALDTVEPLAERIQAMLSHGRRLAMSRRYTWTQHPPDLYVGLTVQDAKLWRQDDAAGFWVRLEPGIIIGFGFAAYGHEGSRTEKEAWARYHAGKADSPLHSERRRSMTHVEIIGGVGAGRDDRIVIQHWNDDGVCDERVIAFDNERTGR